METLAISDYHQYMNYCAENGFAPLPYTKWVAQYEKEDDDDVLVRMYDDPDEEEDDEFDDIEEWSDYEELVSSDLED